MKNYRFCPICKSNLTRVKLDDNHRLECRNCGWIHYDNPIPSVAAFVKNSNNAILLIKRGVAPGIGKWALPSGFIEQNELPEHAVLRELKEETNIRGIIKNLLGVYIEPTTVYGNVLLIAYDIDVVKGKPKHGSDTKEARFFPIGRLPNIPFASHRAIIRDGLAKKESSSPVIQILKSKVTEATITHTLLHYNGSIGIDSKIMNAANILPGEKVHVLNYNNGERLETYTIEEKAGSGKFILYGPASLKGEVGHKLCILSYQYVPMEIAKKIKSCIVVLDRKNKIKRVISKK